MQTLRQRLVASVECAASSEYLSLRAIMAEAGGAKALKDSGAKAARQALKKAASTLSAARKKEGKPYKINTKELENWVLDQVPTLPAKPKQAPSAPAATKPKIDGSKVTTMRGLGKALGISKTAMERINGDKVDLKLSGKSAHALRKTLDETFEKESTGRWRTPSGSYVTFTHSSRGIGKLGFEK